MLVTIAFAILPLLAAAAPTPVPLAKRDTNQLIYAGRNNLCLSVSTGADANGDSSSLSNGLSVVSKPCNEASVWDIDAGSGSIFVSNSNQAYALDAGSNPGNFGELKIWQSYPGLYQQTWYYTDDKRIAITGGDQCLDQGDNGVQTYQCTTGNTNQIWYTTAPTPRNDPQPF